MHVVVVSSCSAGRRPVSFAPRNLQWYVYFSGEELERYQGPDDEKVCFGLLWHGQVLERSEYVYPKQSQSKQSIVVAVQPSHKYHVPDVQNCH